MGLKILWKGPIYNPTGWATAGREYVKALIKLGVKVQVSDPYNSRYDFSKGLEHLNNAIDVNDSNVVTVFYDYPFHWREGHGKIFGGCVHEGTKLIDGWSDVMNQVDTVWCPSNPIKNMFKWNGVNRPITVIPHGVNFDLYKPTGEEKKGTFCFLSVNSWGGEENDRKGTDLLIKAFDEEFKNEEDVRLILKVSTFWMPQFDVSQKIVKLLGHSNPKILVNNKYEDEETLATFYQKSDCFVSPTHGEGFGLTILNAIASGLPVIVTKDNNSGHMDYCKNNPGVSWIDISKMEQGDPKFYTPGNMQPVPSIDSLKKQMRFAYENRAEMQRRGLQGREFIKDFTWENAAKKIIEMVTNERKN